MSTGAGFDVHVLNGLPFLHDAFNAAVLAAGAIATRQHHAAQQDLSGLPGRDDFSAWLSPAVAVHTRPRARSVPSRAVSREQLHAIQGAAGHLAELIPAWRPLFSLPIVYRLLTGTSSLSASTYLWPQHVLLSDVAFESPQSLHELLLHEQCHQWQYLIEELCPLDIPSAQRVTLPSGTPNRAPREVIGAAHVAAATVRMYRVSGPTHAGARIEYFTDYGRSCLALLKDLDDELTDTGRAVARQLQEVL